MWRALTVISFCAAIFSPLRDATADDVASNPMPPAAHEILSRMEKDLNIARTKAFRDLDKVLKDTTKKGDLAGAMAVKEAMDRLRNEIQSPTVAAVGGAIAGRWQTPMGVFDLMPDGTASASSSKGTWTAKGNMVLLQWSNGIQYEMQSTPKGLVGFRIEGGNRSSSTWTKVAPGQ